MNVLARADAEPALPAVSVEPPAIRFDAVSKCYPARGRDAGRHFYRWLRCGRCSPGAVAPAAPPLARSPRGQPDKIRPTVLRRRRNAP